MQRAEDLQEKGMQKDWEREVHHFSDPMFKVP